MIYSFFSSFEIFVTLRASDRGTLRLVEALFLSMVFSLCFSFAFLPQPLFFFAVEVFEKCEVCLVIEFLVEIFELCEDCLVIYYLVLRA